MINIYTIMSGTKAIIPSLFPGKEPAPNKGNKFRVWHQTEAVEGSSQQRDFGNRELGRAPRMSMEKAGGSSAVPELLEVRAVKSPGGFVLGIPQLEQDRV